MGKAGVETADGLINDARGGSAGNGNTEGPSSVARLTIAFSRIRLGEVVENRNVAPLRILSAMATRLWKACAAKPRKRVRLVTVTTPMGKDTTHFASWNRGLALRSLVRLSFDFGEDEVHDRTLKTHCSVPVPNPPGFMDGDDISVVVKFKVHTGA